MGMGVEFAALSRVVAALRQRGDTKISARLTETAANQPCRHVYAEAGLVAGPGGFALPVGNGVVAPDYVQIKQELLL
jgi:hypothetical protein